MTKITTPIFMLKGFRYFTTFLFLFKNLFTSLKFQHTYSNILSARTQRLKMEFSMYKNSSLKHNSEKGGKQ